MLQCSHIICRVDHIGQTVDKLTQMGFRVEWGSRPDRAHNAHIWFEQGPFLEFFQIPRPWSYLAWPLGWLYGQAVRERFRSWLRPPAGWCDIALEPCGEEPTAQTAAAKKEELAVIRQQFVELGMPCSRLIGGNRTRPDGQQVQYYLFAPSSLQLPFIVSRYHPRQRPERIEHPNGAQAVEWVEYVVPESSDPVWRHILPEDPWLRVIPGETESGQIAVGIRGIERDLPEMKIYGART